ncbi:unnamed protein product [Owenia fusiformis]|uniref:Uncharacterized protein n=1 Tax=Owenia fusiformis TaxID=6347 RepID=A0A8J1Y3U3_OWEFU|nr:unnamed protein product [Owenia fusiformis]
MSSPVDENTLDNFLRCKLCEKYLDDPKLLVCLHSFCLKCIVEYTENNPAEEGKICCPECKTEIETSGDLSNLPVNTLAVHMQENTHVKRLNETLCTNCKLDNYEVHASARCMDCNEYVCHECLKAHQRVRLTREHNVVSIADLQSGKYDTTQLQSTPLTLCSTHNEPIKMFCGKCNQALCVVCYATEHNTHPCKNIADVMTNYMDAVAKTLDQVQGKIAGITESVLVVDKYEHDFEKKVAQAQKGIDDRKAQMTQLINKFSEMQFQKLQDVYEKEQKFIQQKRNKLNQHVMSLENTCKFAENLIYYGKGADNMIVGKMVQNRLEGLHGKHLGEKLDRTVSVSFQVTEVNNFDQLFGSIKHAIVNKKAPKMPPSTPSMQRRNRSGSDPQEGKPDKNASFSRVGSMRARPVKAEHDVKTTNGHAE